MPGLESEIEELLAQRALKLNRDELLLLDWVLHHPTPTLTPDLDWHMRWKDLREVIWRGIHVITNNEKQAAAQGKQNQPESITVALDTSDIHVLLALTPTTFRWGPGDDCGFSLKVKLFRYLSGEEEWHDTGDTSKDASTDETEA